MLIELFRTTDFNTRNFRQVRSCVVFLRKSNACTVFWYYCITQATIWLLSPWIKPTPIFFQCEDQKVELLYDTLKRVGESFSQRFPPSISLLLHSSTSYLGFFIDDKHANILKEFAQAFSSEASAVAGRTNISGKMGGLLHKCLGMVLKTSPMSGSSAGVYTASKHPFLNMARGTSFRLQRHSVFVWRLKWLAV